MSQSVQRDFFISYTHADSRWSEWIAWQLEEADYLVILQAWDLPPGANFVSEMERAISNVKRTIAVLSPQYLNALYTQPEWAAAFRHDPKGEQGILVPVRIQECELTGLLGQIIYVDLVGRDEVSAAKILLAGVRHERAKPTVAPTFPEGVQHTVSKQLSFPGDFPSIWNVPYPRDPLFVGREQVLNDLYATLHVKHQAALTSPSDSVQIQDEIVNEVKRWLQTQTQWLLVLEDVQDPEVIQEFISALNRGSLLISSIPKMSSASVTRHSPMKWLTLPRVNSLALLFLLQCILHRTRKSCLLRQRKHIWKSMWANSLATIVWYV